METTQMDNGAHGLYMKPELEAGGTMQKSLYRKSELEAGNTTKKSHPIAEDRIAELDAEAQATYEAGNKAQTPRDNRESTVTTTASSESQALQLQPSTITSSTASALIALCMTFA
jgi:hypothetical protein